MKHSAAPRRKPAHTAKKKSRPAPTSEPAVGSWSTLGRALLCGVGFAAAACILLSALAAAAACLSTDPNALIAPLSLGVLGLSSLLGGYVSYRCARTSAALCGFATGAVLVVLFFLLSYLVPRATNTAWPAAVRWGLRGGVLLFSLLGSTLASYTPRRRSPRRRK